MEDSEKLAFWGIALRPGMPAELDLEDGETLHVTMASFGVELADKNGRSVVTATIRNSEDEDEPEKKYALSALTAGKTETVCMDVSFIGEENVTFEVTGKNEVHLVGNFSFENDIDDSDDEDDGTNLIGVYDDDNDMSDDDGDDDEEMPRLIMDKDPPVITELSDDEEQSANDKKALIIKKKSGSSSKVANGKHSEPVSKKDPKGIAVKASKESVKKSKKDMKVDEPLVEEEEEEEDEEEEDEEDESDDESDEDKREGKVNLKKQEKEAISDDEGDDDSDDESNDEDENESDDDEDMVQPRTSKKDTQKSASGKPSVLFKEAPSQEAIDSDKITPNSAKSKRHRKRHVSIDVSDGVTPPQNKRSKISERPGTPAPSQGSHKRKAAGPATSSKTSRKGGKPSIGGPLSGKKGSSVANGAPSSTPSTPPPKEGASTPGAGGTSGKRKRRRSRKGRDGSS